MISVKEFDRLQGLVDARQADANRADGAYKQLMTQLKEEFGCSTLKEAVTKLAKMKQRMQARSEAFDVAYTEFMAEHGDEIDA